MWKNGLNRHAAVYVAILFKNHNNRWFFLLKNYASIIFAHCNGHYRLC
jgi:hypothetical protein